MFFLRYKNKAKGQVAMPLVLIIIVTFVFLATVVAFIGYNEGAANRRTNESQIAFYLAKAGLNDSLLRLANDYTFATSSYTMTLNYGTAQIEVLADTPSAGKTQITSIGQGTGGFFSIKRKVITIVSFDTNGKIIVESIQEQAL